jgi:hypothetical protein
MTFNDIFSTVTYFVKNYFHIAIFGMLLLKIIHGLEFFAKVYQAWLVFTSFTKNGFSNLKDKFKKK